MKRFLSVLTLALVCGITTHAAPAAKAKRITKLPATKRSAASTSMASSASSETASISEDVSTGDRFFKNYPTSVGFQIGPALYDIDSNARNHSFDAGIAVGFNVETKIYRSIFVQPGLMYVQKGAAIDVAGADDLSRHYFEIPLLVKLKTERPYTAAALTPHIYTGPALGFHLDSHIGDTDLSDDSSPVDFSWVVGLGAEHKLRDRISVFASFQYSFGLIDTVDSNNPAVNGLNVNNSGMQILFGANYAI